MTRKGLRSGYEDVTLPGDRLEPKRDKQRRKLTSSDIWQFLRFCIVGSLNAIIDFGILNLLLWLFATKSTWKTLEYNSVAVLLASTNSFFWNKYWTFQRRNPISFQEVYRFCAIAGGTTFMNDMLLLLLGRIFPGIIGSSLIGANILKLAAIIGTMSISFFGMRLWVFFHHKLAGEVQSLADYETESLPAITLVYDANTIIAGTIKPSHNADTTVIREDDKPNLSMFVSNTTSRWREN